MSILIKGMTMPTSCSVCWALDDYGDYPRCLITEEQRGYNFQILQKRMDNCPFVEVPPHGRLIDADAVEKQIDYVANLDWNIKVGASGGMLAALETVEDAPTVIEAEDDE